MLTRRRLLSLSCVFPFVRIFSSSTEKSVADEQVTFTNNLNRTFTFDGGHPVAIELEPYCQRNNVLREHMRQQALEKIRREEDLKFFEMVKKIVEKR